MSDYESRLEDARRERYEQEHDDDECLSGDPFCARNPRSAGTYEAYSGSICGACEDRCNHNTVVFDDCDLCFGRGKE